MSGDVKSMSLIQSYWRGRRFQNRTVVHVWANSWALVIHILPLWPTSTTSLWDMCHHSINWSLTTCLTLYLALAMMHCLMIFVTIFLNPLSWQWPIPSSWRILGTCFDIGHVWDTYFYVPGHFLQKRPWPKVVWGHIFCPLILRGRCLKLLYLFKNIKNK